jgi:hypothetical protein
MPSRARPAQAPALQLEGSDSQTAAMRPAREKSAFDSINEIATVHIELRYTYPIIWRQVELPTSITLKVLHDTIQAVMGWLNLFLWEFTIGGQKYAMPIAKKAAARFDANRVRMRDVLNPQKTIIDYSYGLGGRWAHQLTVTDIRTGQPDLFYPRYLGGECNAPPELCGGISGFYEMLEAIANPNHQDHVQFKQWFDEYDPRIVDELPIKYALSRIANRRNAAKVRLAKKSETTS